MYHVLFSHSLQNLSFKSPSSSTAVSRKVLHHKAANNLSSPSTKTSPKAASTPKLTSDLIIASPVQPLTPSQGVRSLPCVLLSKNVLPVLFEERESYHLSYL